MKQHEVVITKVASGLNTKKMVKNRDFMPNSNEILQFWQNSKEINKPFLAKANKKTCFACGYNVGTQRSHIIPLNMGGTNKIENLHLLCRFCHYESERLHGSFYFEWFSQKNTINSGNANHIGFKVEMLFCIIKENIKDYFYLSEKQIGIIVKNFYEFEETTFLYFCKNYKIESLLSHEKIFLELIFEAVCICEQNIVSFATKKGLQQAKNEGVKLGNPANLTKEARGKGILSNIKKARLNQNNINAKEMIKLCLDKGSYSFYKISRILNNQGFKTSQGKCFEYIQVKRLIEQDPIYFAKGSERIAKVLENKASEIAFK